jgi:hypothetical protein
MGKRESKSLLAKDLSDPVNAGCAKDQDVSEKVCSGPCGKRKPITAYYSKGDRVDSRCKECTKTARNERYASAESKENTKQIAQIISVLVNHQTDEVACFNKKFENFLRSVS